MIRRAEIKGGRILTRTVSDPFDVQQHLALLVDEAGEPVGLELDRRYYRIKPSPRLRMYPGWRYQPMLEVKTVAYEGVPEPSGEPDPAA